MPRHDVGRSAGRERHDDRHRAKVYVTQIRIFRSEGLHGQVLSYSLGRNMNIYEVGTGQTQVAIWCFGPVGHLPLGDVMLAQKLALKTDEQAALAVANRSGC